MTDTDALAGLDRREAALEAARTEVRAHRRAHADAQDSFRQLTAAKNTRQQRHPGDYTADLKPRKDTEAATIEADLRGLGKTDFTEEIEKAQHAERQIAAELYAYRFDNARPIAEALTAAGDEAARRITAALRDARGACAEYLGLDQKFGDFLNALPGAIGHGDVRSDEGVAALARMIDRLSRRQIAGIHSHSLSPDPDLAEGESYTYIPDFVLNVDRSGFITVANAQVVA